MSSSLSLTDVDVQQTPIHLLLAAFFSCLASWACFYLLVSAPLLWSDSVSFSGLFSAGHLMRYVSWGYALRFLGGVCFAFVIDRFSRPFCFYVFNGLSLVFCAIFLVAPFMPSESFGMPFLAMAHLAQSFVAGGQAIFLMMLVVESTPSRRRGLYSSIIFLPLFFALLICFAFSLFCYYFLSFHDTLYWAWPVFMILPILFALLAIYFFRLSSHTPSVLSDGISPFSGGRVLNWWSTLVCILCVGLGTGAILFMLFYSFMYLYQTLHVALSVLLILFGVASFLSIPLFVFFGWFSDKIGRLPFILAALIFAGLSYHGLFSSLMSFAHPRLAESLVKSPIVLNYNETYCPLMLSEGPMRHSSDINPMCSQFKLFFDEHGISIQTIPLSDHKPSFLSVRGESFFVYDDHLLKMAIRHSGYDLVAPFIEINIAKLMVTIMIFMIYIAMIGGPLLAYSVEVTAHRWRFMNLSFFFYLSNIWFFIFFVSYLFYVNPSFQLYHLIVWSSVILCFVSVLAAIIILRDSYDPHHQCLVGHAPHDKKLPEKVTDRSRALSDLRKQDGQESSVLHSMTNG